LKSKQTQGHENHERWLVSYADFITLLFAFFVVMFATAQKDKTKQRIVAESVRDALQKGQLTTTIQGIISQRKVPPNGKGDTRQNPEAPEPLKPPEKPVPASKEDLARALARLKTILAKELEKGNVAVKLDDRGLVVSMRELAFFDSGDDVINPASLPIIEKIAQVIATLPNAVRLEGHTDSIPIHNSRFRSNWELSTARSIAMLEVLRNRYDLPAERMSVAGFAENAPVDSNDTQEGRMHNRRVDLVVLSAEALRGEPVASPVPEAARSSANVPPSAAKPSPLKPELPKASPSKH
jgi:chemotaxis protein MotB